MRNWGENPLSLFWQNCKCWGARDPCLRAKSHLDSEIVYLVALERQRTHLVVG